MDITLCNNLSENNIINKNILDKQIIYGAKIKGEISVETPTLIFEYTGNMSDVNYFKIPEFNRSYYVTDIINLPGSRYEIMGKTDVLESFKDAILSLTAIIDKQAINGVNKFIDDGSYIVENKEFNTVINFPSGFNTTGEYILITAGGGGGII